MQHEFLACARTIWILTIFILTLLIGHTSNCSSSNAFTINHIASDNPQQEDMFEGTRYKSYSLRETSFREIATFF